MRPAYAWKLHRLLAAAGTAGLFLLLALFIKGLILDVDYRQGRVLRIVQVPGKTLSDRLVIVDLGDHQRPLRTSDRLLNLREGGPACVAQRRILLRRWNSYSLKLPGFCRGHSGRP